MLPLLGVVVLLAFLHWFVCGKFCCRPIKTIHRMLLVIAHPDDECMFFAPCLLSLIADNVDVFVLCLSSGNNKRQGIRRKVELRKSCQVMGIPVSHITVIDHSKMPDDPMCLWNKGFIKHIVLRYIEQLGIDTVLTFDSYGVSSHLNHCSVYRAIQHMYTKALFPPATQVFVLETVSLLRKYLSFLDLTLSSLSATHIYVSNFRNVWRAQLAMLQHRTQLTWYRTLYIIFSRYMVINTFKRIRMEDNYYKYDKKAGSNRT